MGKIKEEHIFGKNNEYYLTLSIDDDGWEIFLEDGEAELFSLSFGNDEALARMNYDMLLEKADSLSDLALADGFFWLEWEKFTPFNADTPRAELLNRFVFNKAFAISKEIDDLERTYRFLAGLLIPLHDKYNLLDRQIALVKSEFNRLIDYVCEVREIEDSKK